MPGQHAPNHVLIDLEDEHKTKLLCDPAAAPAWIPSLDLDNAREDLVGPAFEEIIRLEIGKIQTSF